MLHQTYEQANILGALHHAFILAVFGPLNSVGDDIASDFIRPFDIFGQLGGETASVARRLLQPRAEID